MQNLTWGHLITKRTYEVITTGSPNSLSAANGSPIEKRKTFYLHIR